MIIVTIPVYNELKNGNAPYLAYNINFFKNSDIVDTLIVCDDGSKDESYNFLKKCTNKGNNSKVILTKNEINIGKTKTVNRCINKYSNDKNDIIVTWDASAYQINDSIFREFLDPIINKSLDLNILVRESLRYYPEKALCLLLRIQIGNAVCTPSKKSLLVTFSGQRVFRRCLWDRIPDNIKNGSCYGMEIGINYLVKYGNVKYGILKAGIDVRGARKHSKKHGRFISQVFPIIYVWAKIILFYAPIHYVLLNWSVVILTLYFLKDYGFSPFFIIVGLVLLLILN